MRVGKKGNEIYIYEYTYERKENGGGQVGGKQSAIKLQ